MLIDFFAVALVPFFPQACLFRVAVAYCVNIAVLAANDPRRAIYRIKAVFVNVRKIGIAQAMNFATVFVRLVDKPREVFMLRLFDVLDCYSAERNVFIVLYHIDEIVFAALTVKDGNTLPPRSAFDPAAVFLHLWKPDDRV